MLKPAFPHRGSKSISHRRCRQGGHSQEAGFESRTSTEAQGVPTGIETLHQSPSPPQTCSSLRLWNGLSLHCRLCAYRMSESRVTLTALHESQQHEVLVCSKLVEPFHAQLGSLYIVLGELEHQAGKLSEGCDTCPGREAIRGIP